MSFLSIETDTRKITSLNAKLAKYPPAAIRAGLEAANEFLNTDEFKGSMYPKRTEGRSAGRFAGRFRWSSDNQRKKVMALLREQGGPPYKRTFELRDGGTFTVNPSSFWVGYSNTVAYSPYVIDPSRQIVGHRARGWKGVHIHVVAKSAKIAQIFRKAVKEAWTKLESFMFGGGGGL